MKERPGRSVCSHLPFSLVASLGLGLIHSAPWEVRENTPGQSSVSLTLYVASNRQAAQVPLSLALWTYE